MFEGFKKKLVKVNRGKIFCRFKGNGPPLLLLHGYPQTHLMWNKTAPELSKYFTVVVADLRGYGNSLVLPGGKNHFNYSTREMAKDMVQLMDKLNFKKFFVAGHDRGGRVAHRMARDFRKKILALSVLDICPTLDMYEKTNEKFAKSYFHWFFLIQPADIPERMIGADPEFYLNKKFKQWGEDNDAFSKKAFSEYLRCFTSETIKASCEDYRASASIDLEHDQIDIDNNNKIECPMMVIWGDKGYVGNKYDIITEWKKFATHVVGYSLPCGHYLPEEAPNETLQALVTFL